MIMLKAYIEDITREVHEGAIVNAAKESLLGGGGVDGAIHRAAGPRLLEACKKLSIVNDDGARCPTGGAVMTDGFELNVPHIIHTVAPIYKDDSRIAPRFLAACYSSCIRVALSQGLSEISFPAIGTGIYGYPLEAATVIAVNTVLQYAKDNLDINRYSVSHNITVNFVCFDEASFLMYKRVIDAAKNHWCVAEVF